ncbi:hypothetical protein [Agrobacterium cavarae]|uniref:hypothetical protein n=1 Tax=Agrobacterium cavarae TaxID=2528239 RepID=UPI003FD19DB4
MSDGAVTTELRGPLVDKNEVLLRLVWDSDDLDPVTRTISTSAFSKRDLQGAANGLSVDQKSLAIRGVILSIAGKQQSKAEGNPDLNRTDALLSQASAGDIFSQCFDDKQKMFSVISTPIEASEENLANPAHAEIINISGRSKKSDILKLRLKLQPLFDAPQPIDKVLPQPEQKN